MKKKAEKSAEPIPPHRKIIEDRAQQMGKTLKELSLKLKRGHAYLQQYIHLGKPKKLDGDYRAALAAWLELDERKLIAPGDAPLVTLARTVALQTAKSLPPDVIQFAKRPGDTTAGLEFLHGEVELFSYDFDLQALEDFAEDVQIALARLKKKHQKN